MAKKTKLVPGTDKPTYAERARQTRAQCETLEADPEFWADLADEIDRLNEIVANAEFTEREVLFLSYMREIYDIDDKNRLTVMTPHRAAQKAGYKSPVMGSRLMKRPHIHAALMSDYLNNVVENIEQWADPENASGRIKVTARDRDGD